MDILLQSYLEETEELLQSAEECMIRLESDYSQIDINELFRIVHTIKGSSQLMGYEDIGELMHKIEDMLDYIRNERLTFDEDIIGSCFEGLDIVNRMLDFKKEAGPESEMAQLSWQASAIRQRVDEIIQLRKQEEKEIETKPEIGLVSYLLSKKSDGKNKFHLCFKIEDDPPMASLVLMMILQNVDDIGSLLYSSISDQFFNDQAEDDDIRSLEIIVVTDLDKAELREHFDLFYVESINITDLNLGQVPKIDGGTNTATGLSQQGVIELLDKASALISQQELWRTFKPAQEGEIERLKNFIKQIPDSIQLVAIDMSNLTIVQEKDLKALIGLNKELQCNNIELVIIVGGPYGRRILNIFDSIRAIAEFRVYKNELEAVLATFQLQEFFRKLNLV